MGDGWKLNRGESCLFHPTLRHTVQPEELVALIVCPFDTKYKQAAKVISLEKGNRQRVGGSYSEDCLFLYLAFISGDHGIWTAPLYGLPYLGTSHHSVPYLFYRLPAREGSNPAAGMMDTQGRGFRHFVGQYTTLRNGTGDLDNEYFLLFGTSLPSSE